MTHKINTTECTWKIRGIRRYYGNVTIQQFGDSSYNHGPHTYGVCTFTLTHPLHVNNSSPVDIVGRHSLAIESKFAIRISAPFILDWSPARNRSDMWLGGFCSHDHHMNKTNGRSRITLFREGSLEFDGAMMQMSANFGSLSITLSRKDNHWDWSGQPVGLVLGSELEIKF